MKMLVTVVWGGG